ncbi:hypothetical protein P5V15_001461 [Pogonomyrmex californicus]
MRDRVLCRNWESPDLKTIIIQVAVPQKMVPQKNQVLKEIHEEISPSGEHYVVNKSLEKIQKRFFWSICKQDVEHWIRTCKVCIEERSFG